MLWGREGAGRWHPRTPGVQLLRPRLCCEVIRPTGPTVVPRVQQLNPPVVSPVPSLGLRQAMDTGPYPAGSGRRLHRRGWAGWVGRCSSGLRRKGQAACTRAGEVGVPWARARASRAAGGAAGGQELRGVGGGGPHTTSDQALPRKWPSGWSPARPGRLGALASPWALRGLRSLESAGWAGQAPGAGGEGQLSLPEATLHCRPSHELCPQRAPVTLGRDPRSGGPSRAGRGTPGLGPSKLRRPLCSPLRRLHHRVWSFATCVFCIVG